MSYDDADPAAFDVSTLPRLSKSKPNGVAPTAALTIGGPATPWGPTDVGVDRARRLLGDHERLAVGRERDLRRSGATRTERTRRAGERRQSVVLDDEAGDVPGAARVQDVEHVPVLRQAGRRGPPEGTVARHSSPSCFTLNCEIVLLPALTAKRVVPVLAQDERALRTEIAARSDSTGRVRPVRRERAVLRTLEHGDRVSGWGVRERVDRAGRVMLARRARCTDGEQHPGAQDQQRNSASMHDESSSERWPEANSPVP